MKRKHLKNKNSNHFKAKITSAVPRIKHNSDREELNSLGGLISEFPGNSSGFRVVES
jgi:hypothetical protein